MCWVFVAVRGLSLVAARGGYSSLQCAGFSLRTVLIYLNLLTHSLVVYYLGMFTDYT